MSMNTSPASPAAGAGNGPQKRTGLGRGLGSLIPSAPARSAGDVGGGSATAVAEPTVVVKEVIKEVFRDVMPTDGSMVLQVPIGKIVPNPMQPRATFSHQELEDLMNSIAEHGILQPITVTQKGDGYELVAGERRFRAAKMLGLEKVPAILREADTEEKLVLALIENIQRENLNSIEEAKGYRLLIDEHGFTQDEVAKKVGKARPTVANMMRLLDLPREIQDAIAIGKVSTGSARAILALPDDEQRMKFFQTLMNEKMTTREIERRIRRQSGRDVEKAPSLAALEEQLREVVGARVEVRKRNGEGTITISFYSESELSAVTRKLMGLASIVDAE